jgi:hypothetical protein
MRTDLDERPNVGGLYRRLPSWTFRAFGIWAVVFGIGQLIAALTVLR